MNDDVSKLIEVCNNIYDRQLVSGKSGNVSIRLGDYIAITPTLKPINGLNEKEIVLVDMDGNSLTNGDPSSEVGMHLGIYKKRDDINLVFADSSMKIISDSVSFKFLPAHKMPCFFKINASFSIIFSDAFKASSLLPGFS